MLLIIRKQFVIDDWHEPCSLLEDLQMFHAFSSRKWQVCNLSSLTGKRKWLLEKSLAQRFTLFFYIICV